jgi:peptidoglycan/LPS O-acetylase OafA/YrhL
MVQLWRHPHFDGVSFVGPAWSISAEWLAYVCFPVVALLLFRLRRLPAAVNGLLAVVAMAPLAYSLFQTGDPNFAWGWLARITGGFLAGALTCLAVRKIRVTEKVERIAAVVAVLAVVEILLALWWGDWRGQGQGDFGGVAVVLFPVLVGSLALSRRGLSRVLSTPVMVHGGRISFSLYLVHVPVFEIFWTEMGWHNRIGPGTALGTILIPHVLVGVVVLAHLTYRYVEEPARLFLRDRGPGRLARRPAAAPSPAPAAAQPPLLAPVARPAAPVRGAAVARETGVPGPRVALGRQARPVADTVAEH